jgi:hypothetical protein
MKVYVENVFQSPCTPPVEVAYLIQFFEIDKETDDEVLKLLRKLEELHNNKSDFWRE